MGIAFRCTSPRPKFPPTKAVNTYERAKVIFGNHDNLCDHLKSPCENGHGHVDIRFMRKDAQDQRARYVSKRALCKNKLVDGAWDGRLRKTLSCFVFRYDQFSTESQVLPT